MLRETITNDWATLFFILSLLIITVVKLLYAKRFEDFWIVLFNSKYLKIYAREQKLLDSFNSWLFVNFCIAMAIFSILGYSYIDNTIEPSITMILLFSGSICLFYLLKFLLEYIVAKIFEIESISMAYLFQKLTFFNYLGVLFLPINIILVFWLTTWNSLIYVGLFLVVIVLLVGFISSFKNYQTIIKSNLFYFILYLCALEISPYIILYKLIIQ